MPAIDPSSVSVAAVSATRRAVAVAVAIAVVFAALVVGAAWQMRVRWRSQALAREGEVLQAVALMQQAVVADAGAGLGLPGDDEPMLVALHTSKLRGVLAVRVFDEGGEFFDAVPAEVEEGRLSESDRATLVAGRAVVRFRPSFLLRELFLGRVDEERASLLEVNVALAPAADGIGGRAFVQYWADGSAVAAEFARLDREIALQAAVALAAGWLVIGGLVTWAFRRLAAAQRLLQRRADDLARANRELAQAARTAAIGAITAHLMHGLRNPLAGLEGLVAGPNGVPEATAGEWASARESMRRLRAIVDETLAVLRDVQDGAAFEMTAAEVCAGLRERVQPLATRRDVKLEVAGALEARMDAHAAGLGGLVLANVVQNAIEASPPDGLVRIDVAQDGEALGFSVSDQGPGLSAEVRADPFRPRRSSKADGAGVGLALSRELARHAGGELELVQGGPGGTVFRLRLPGAGRQRTT
jgi:signal transduction histidine kinase